MKWIDLSHRIKKNMTTYPSDPDVSIILEKSIQEGRSQLHSFSMGTHTGTHVDAASHIIEKGKSLDEYPISTFSGIAIKEIMTPRATPKNAMRTTANLILGLIGFNGIFGLSST